jgi:branched-chain amino acid transport system permease protein
MISLSARNLTKSFGHVLALNNVSVRVLPGKITGLMGPNGAGKSTLFYLLSGDIAPDSGEVWIEGGKGGPKSIAGTERFRVARAGVGFLYQDVRVFESLSLLDNVLVAMNNPQADNLFWDIWHARHLGEIKSRHCQEALYWLDYVGLGGDRCGEARLKMKAAELSYGQKKLLSLAQLMARKSEVLLLDEPMAGLSGHFVEKIELLIKRICREKGATIAIIEHDIQVLERMADFVYFMAEGEIVFFGLTGHVLGNETVRRTYIGME